MRAALLLGLLSAIGATDRPVIAVLTVPIEGGDCVTLARDATASGATSCFHSLYVKWIEAAGARVAPLRYDAPADEFDALLASTNGALITGGEADVTDLRSAYMRAAGRMYNFSLAEAARGEVWPLWGTCMGMQVLSVLGAADGAVLLPNAFDSERMVLALDPTPAAATSRLLCGRGCLPASARVALLGANLTVNLHHDGIAPASFAPGTALGRAFTVLSTNADRRGKRFVSTIEAAGGAPIWGVQWHPERPQFQWGEPAWGPAGDFMDHSALAVDTMHAVAAFFVRQARRSTHAWRNARDEAAALIYNYAPVVSASSYQAYLF